MSSAYPRQQAMNLLPLLLAHRGLVLSAMMQKHLYHFMQQAYASVENKISVSEFYIAGFSIGAMPAAFLDELDSRRQQFCFNKIMMINPPVRLYDSAQRINQFLERNLSNGIENVGVFAESIFNRYPPIFNQSWWQRN
ncbi:MAG: hypothetical protein GXP21_04770 [Gammaproteobacteria bacterium]|nr:hypothetical protein [Gammaproteobacteria bacterium]